MRTALYRPISENKIAKKAKDPEIKELISRTKSHKTMKAETLIKAR